MVVGWVNLSNALQYNLLLDYHCYSLELYDYKPGQLNIFNLK